MPRLIFDTYHEASVNEVFARGVKPAKYNGKDPEVSVLRIFRFDMPTGRKTMEFILGHIDYAHLPGSDMISDSLREAVPDWIVKSIETRDSQMIDILRDNCEIVPPGEYIDIVNARVPRRMFELLGGHLEMVPEYYDDFIRKHEEVQGWANLVELDNGHILDKQKFYESMDYLSMQFSDYDYVEEIREHKKIIYDGLDIPEKVMSLHHYLPWQHHLAIAKTALKVVSEWADKTLRNPN